MWRKAYSTRYGFVLVALILVITLILGCFAPHLFSGARESEFHSISGKFTNTHIESEADAIAVAKEAAKLLGLGNGAEEMELVHIAQFNGATYYRLQQYRNGIVVHGKNMVLIADISGTAMGAATNITQVDVSLEDQLLSWEEVESSTQRYFQNNGTYSSCRIGKPQNLQEVLVLYPVDDDYQYVYRLPVFYGDDDLSSETVVLDALNGKVLTIESSVMAASYLCMTPNRQTKVYGRYDEEDHVYRLEDEDRQIYIGNLQNRNSEIEGTKYEFITSENTIFGDNEEERNLDAEQAVRYLYNVSRVFDCFSEQNMAGGYKKLIACFNDSWASGKNAKSFTGTQRVANGNEKIGYISMGSQIGVERIDVIAHEYMHNITTKNVGWIEIGEFSEQPNEPGAINEGYSDLFGEIIESMVLNQEPDWANAFRNIANPKSVGYPANTKDNKFENIDGQWGMRTESWIKGGYTDYSHGFSTIISHCGYLMYNGVDGTHDRFSREELLKLWYQTMLILPSNCTFAAFREYMEMTADMMNLSEGKKQCIAAAFDTVGITSTYQDSNTYKEDPILYVYDAEGELCKEYTLTITGKEFNGLFHWGLWKRDYSQTVHVSSNGNNSAVPYTLKLAPGDYTLSVQPSGFQDTKSTSIQVRNKGKKTDIVLTVLFKQPAVTEETQIGVESPSNKNAPATISQPTSSAYEKLNTLVDRYGYADEYLGGTYRGIVERDFKPNEKNFNNKEVYQFTEGATGIALQHIADYDADGTDELTAVIVRNDGDIFRINTCIDNPEWLSDVLMYPGLGSWNHCCVAVVDHYLVTIEQQDTASGICNDYYYPVLHIDKYDMDFLGEVRYNDRIKIYDLSTKQNVLEMKRELMVPGHPFRGNQVQIEITSGQNKYWYAPWNVTNTSDWVVLGSNGEANQLIVNELEKLGIYGIGLATPSWGNRWNAISHNFGSNYCEFTINCSDGSIVSDTEISGTVSLTGKYQYTQY